ncbi:unnamed protein product [Merluccius merluccius]
MKLGKVHVAFKENGMLLIPDPKLKSDILEGLIQEVVKYTVYLTDSKFDEIAEGDIDAGRESIIKGLCIYLNENPDVLVQE